MITFYAALGRFDTRITDDGTKIPIVIADEKEHHLSMEELFIWSSLAWSILTFEELKSAFAKKVHEARYYADIPFKGTLERLIARNLVASGCNYVAVDAIYTLISKLYIRPIESTLFSDMKTFLYLLLFKRVPYKTAKDIFKRPRLSKDEQQVLNLANQIMMTSAEIMKCVNIGLKRIKNEDMLVDSLYDDDEGDVTYKNIDTFANFYDIKRPVLQAISNLYLKKLVIFEKLAS